MYATFERDPFKYKYCREAVPYALEDGMGNEKFEYLLKRTTLRQSKRINHANVFDLENKGGHDDVICRILLLQQY